MTHLDVTDKIDCQRACLLHLCVARDTHVTGAWVAVCMFHAAHQLELHRDEKEREAAAEGEGPSEAEGEGGVGGEGHGVEEGGGLYADDDGEEEEEGGG